MNEILKKIADEAADIFDMCKGRLELAILMTVLGGLTCLVGFLVILTVKLLIVFPVMVIPIAAGIAVPAVLYAYAKKRAENESGK